MIIYDQDMRQLCHALFLSRSARQLDKELSQNVSSSQIGTFGYKFTAHWHPLATQSAQIGFIETLKLGDMMKRKTVLAIGLIATTSLAGASAFPALAGGNHGSGHGGQTGHKTHSGQGMMGQGMQGGQHGSGSRGMAGGQGGHGGNGMMNPEMMQMMMRMHSQMMGGGGMMTGGMMGGGMMGNPMFKSFDTDGDGRVSPEEMRAGQKAKLEQFDADGDGSLSLDEFEALHSAAIRERMVDKFQALDNDGDGQVTSEEMAAPARKMERMQRMRAEPGQKHPGAMMGGDNETGEENN